MANSCTLLSAAAFCSLAVSSGFGAAPVSDRAAARLLDQAAWGPTPGDIAQVQSLGIDGWIQAQFNATPSDLPDQPLLNAQANTNTDVTPLRAVIFQNAVTKPDQLLQRVTWALSQIWVVSQQSGVTPAYAYPPYWRVLRDSALKNYADVISSVTMNPAMGRYLNMVNNVKANPAKGTSPNENYGRELMQLFTLGLTQLNPDGTPVLDVNGLPMPTYTEAEVRDMAKALTGWTYPTMPAGTPKAANPEYYFGPMEVTSLSAANHDITAKTVFGGYPIPAGQSAQQDLQSVVKGLMQQPTLAPFVCRQLIEHMVTSNPSPQYIQRVSGVFQNNGKGVAGDLQSVIKAILEDPEARNGDNASDSVIPTAGHLREPVLLFANLLRGLNANVPASPTGQAGVQTNSIGNVASTLNEAIFDSPSVFSYFSPASRTERGLYGPEFQIYSTQTASARDSNIYSLIYNSSFSGVTTDLSKFNGQITKVSDPAALIDYISYVFLHHAASPELIANATAAAKAAATPANAVKSALFVMLTSSEYQIVH